jgi:hypothetical protein
MTIDEVYALGSVVTMLFIVFVYFITRKKK